jgi:hypothetical protein
MVPPVTIVRTMIKALAPGNILTSTSSAAMSLVDTNTSIEIPTLLEAPSKLRFDHCHHRHYLGDFEEIVHSMKSADCYERRAQSDTSARNSPDWETWVAEHSDALERHCSLAVAGMAAGSFEPVHIRC